MLHVSKDKRHVEHERSDGIGGTVANTKSALHHIRRNPHIGKERNKDEGHESPLGSGRDHNKVHKMCIRDRFIIVNFDHISVDVAINVPSHAFDFLQIPQMDIYPAVDLLTGKTESISLLPYKATEISVEGYSGKMLKIKL